MSRPDDDQKNNASNPMPFVQQGDDDRTVIVSPANPDATVFTAGSPAPRYPAYFSNDEIPRPKPSRKTRPVIGFSHFGKGKEAQRTVLPNLPIARELPGIKTKVVTIPPKAAAAAQQSGAPPAGANAPSSQSRIQSILSGGVLGQHEAKDSRTPDYMRQSFKHKVAALSQSEESDDNRKAKRMCREEVLNILARSGGTQAPAASGEPQSVQQSAPQASGSRVPTKPPTSLRRLLGSNAGGKKSDDESKPNSDYRAVISASGSYLSMKVEGGLLTGASFERCQQRLVDIENGAPMRNRYRRSYSGNQEDTAGMEAAKKDDSNTPNSQK